MATAWKRPIDHRSTRIKFVDFLIGKHPPAQPPVAPVAPARAAVSATAAPDQGPRREVIGICCSGGGIRSAAYNLGALQVLAKEKILHQASYLSAVSGGSYIAASHSIVAGATADLGSTPVYAPGSPEEQFLRNHSSYIAPSLRGRVNLALRLFAGIAVNFGFIGLSLFVLSRPLGWLYTRGLHIGGNSLGPLQRDFLHNPRPHVVITTWMWRTVLWPAGAAGLMSIVGLLIRPPRAVERFLGAWARRLFGFALVAFVILVALPELIRFTRVDLPRYVHDALPFLARGLKVGTTPDKTDGTTSLEVIAAIAGSSMVLGALRAFVVKERSYVAQFIGAVIGPVGLLAVLLLFLNEVTFVGLSWRTFEGWLVALGVFAFLYAISDLTRWSMHPFYKRRLSSAFAIHRISTQGPDGKEHLVAREILEKDLPRLSKSQPNSWKRQDGRGYPELIVCAAANISDEGATPPKRNAASFTFSADSVGGPLLGTYPTSELEEDLGTIRGRDLTLPAAVAVSGAAVSPSMGKMTKASLRFLMGLLNVRLGVWLPNPRWLELRKERRGARQDSRFPVVRWVSAKLGRVAAWYRETFKNPRLRMRPRPIYLVRELLGLNSMDDKFLYVTDGGHYENLGLIELLRRGCTIIYCFDASGGDVDTFYTLGEAIELARIEPDVQVEITIDPRDLKLDKDLGFCSNDHVRGTFAYPDGITTGKLVYCRAAVTKDAPYDIRSFQQKDPRFPHHSTADQLFDEYKFEAYRALGAYTAQRAVDDMAELPAGDPQAPGPGLTSDAHRTDRAAGALTP